MNDIYGLLNRCSYITDKIFFFLFCSFGDKYIERFQYILLIDEKTTLEDLQLTLFQAMIFRVLVIAYEVRIVVS